MTKSAQCQQIATILVASGVTLTKGQIITGAAAAAGLNDIAFGVVLDDVVTTVANTPVPVQIGGIAVCVAGEAFSAGVRVSTSGSGKVREYTIGTETATAQVGVAMDAASADGDYVRVRLGF